MMDVLQKDAAVGPGHFVWYELFTTDPEAAGGFYGHVVGWSVEPAPGGHGRSLFASGQGPLAVSTTLPEPVRQMGVPPYWTSHVLVADVDATASLARELGGRVYVAPVDVPGMGRFAVVADPFGAVLSLCALVTLMRPRDRSGPGEICWHELITEDPRAALDFYGRLFGWQPSGELDMGPAGRYVLFGHDGQDLGGMFPRPQDMPYSAWNYYLQVADLDAALARARSKGAAVISGPMAIPGGARVAVLKDPQGAGFGLHQNP
ncbi:MAG: glyoxalase [Deltaproteobacteria bacterium HGW-Deltaproteobacteria-17]|nr:MAG: glyoxalase [Deltaproteobacteria bacterium HGW-Deltaproteobacteria-17]